METVCVIPARFESSRFPGKLIEKLDGREIILHVLDKVKKSKIPKIIVATDSDIIKIIVEKNGVEAVMTPPELPSGTDRIAFAVKKLGIETDYVLNVQGDEPFMEPELIDALVSAHYKNSSIDIFTAVKEAADKEIDDPNSVKVVISENNSALYFSRAVIPFYRDNLQLKKYWVHIGIYHYNLIHFLSLLKYHHLN